MIHLELGTFKISNFTDGGGSINLKIHCFLKYYFLLKEEHIIFNKRFNTVERYNWILNTYWWTIKIYDKKWQKSKKIKNRQLHNNSWKFQYPTHNNGQEQPDEEGKKGNRRFNTAKPTISHKYQML